MTKIRASKCEIREVSVDEERIFLNMYHYQEYAESRICYGLYYKNDLVCLMSFCKPRFNHFYSWELLRLCTKKDYQIYGGASKLFNYFLDENDVGNGIISYCNRDKFNGKVYKILGFRSNGITKGYHYEKDGKIIKRYQMQKNKNKKLENIQKTIEAFGGTYYKNLSEKENAERNGFKKIEDKIGQELFIFGDKARMYIYKIVFDDGKTYIGQHIQYNENDKYVTSSSYYKQGHNIKSKSILIEVNDRFTLDFMETVCILSDKAENGKNNVNGNKGNFIYNHPYNIGKQRNYKWSENTRSKFSETRKGHLTSEETKDKISKANKGKVRTEEMRKHISDAHKGYKMPEKQRKKISLSMKGGNQTSFKKGYNMNDETKAKISNSSTKYVYIEISTNECHTMKEWQEIYGYSRNKINNANKFKKELK